MAKKPRPTPCNRVFLVDKKPTPCQGKMEPKLVKVDTYFNCECHGETKAGAHVTLSVKQCSVCGTIASLS